MIKKSSIHYLRFFLFISLMILINNGILYSQTYVPAELVGGKKQLKEFVNMEIQIPENAIQEKVKGKVELSFIIEKDGRIDNINIEKSINNEIDNEAIRILKKTLWKPAKKFGKIVASREKLVINFNYKKYKRLCKRRGYDKLNYLHLPVDTSNIVFDLKKTQTQPSPIFSKRFYTLNQFIIDNIKYPGAAYSQDISGEVILNFVVEPHGQVSHITIEKALGGGCNEEAIRVLKLLKWNPGIKDNKAVRVKMHMNITFVLPENSGKQYLPNNQNNTL